MTKDKIKKLRDMVEYCLQYHPKTRNSDVTLTVCIWKQFYHIQDTIDLNQLYDLPREDNIKRIRATFNAAGKFWPTEQTVAIKRGINREAWQEWLLEHKQTQMRIDDLLSQANAEGAFDEI